MSIGEQPRGACVRQFSALDCATGVKVDDKCALKVWLQKGTNMWIHRSGMTKLEALYIEQVYTCICISIACVNW